MDFLRYQNQRRSLSSSSEYVSGDLQILTTGMLQRSKLVSALSASAMAKILQLRAV